VTVITTGLPPIPGAPRITGQKRAALPAPILKLKSSKDAG
jgi:hypothetical protein